MEICARMARMQLRVRTMTFCVVAIATFLRCCVVAFLRCCIPAGAYACMCMCMCMCACACACSYVMARICTRIPTRATLTHADTGIYLRTYIAMASRSHVRARTYAGMHVCTYACMSMCAYTCKDMRTGIGACDHAPACPHACAHARTMSLQMQRMRTTLWTCANAHRARIRTHACARPGPGLHAQAFILMPAHHAHTYGRVRR